MGFLVPWWQQELLFDYRGCHCTHFSPFSKPTQNSLKGITFMVRLIKDGSKKMLEKCALRCQMVELCQAALVTTCL